MKTIGEPIFAKAPDGTALSRIGTMFFRTPGLVTKRGIHAMQRAMWIAALNDERVAGGRAPLTSTEEDAEMAESVDLIFTDDLVLIRPDPDRMDLAFRADEVLQKMVSKRAIRYLNTHAAKVRRALCERGENWRMARQPISQEDMAELITKSRVAIGEQPVYYYNRATGTRFVTVGGYAAVAALDDAAYLRQVREVVLGMNKVNRFGHPEVDVFPAETPIDIRRGFRALDVEHLDAAALRAAIGPLETAWRMSLPAELRAESVDNYAWRNALCQAITAGPNETAADESELIAGIAPEFYRQIEWLPGARMDRGEVVFDTLYDEAERTHDPAQLALCDNRVKSILFNMTRLVGTLDYVNIGRIAQSLARHPVAGERRGGVYIVQYRAHGAAQPEIDIIRIQKWGVTERLDEGKDLLQAIVESDEYSDFILDRRLMCRQLGMNLPNRLGCSYFTERYRGQNAYNGCTVRTVYFSRAYVAGVASDKIPVARFRNPVFAQAFATLMGRAAAIDLVVGRRNSQTRAFCFDQNFEVVLMDARGLPTEVKVTDHAGSFVNYDEPLEAGVVAYAAVITRRRAFVADYAAFRDAYVAGFTQRLTEVQTAYRERRTAFDRLFADRPYDTNGSGAYRWSCALRRLDVARPTALAAQLREAIGC